MVNSPQLIHREVIDLYYLDVQKDEFKQCCHGSIPIAQFRLPLLFFSRWLHSSLLQIGFSHNQERCHPEMPKFYSSTLLSNMKTESVCHDFQWKNAKQDFIGPANSLCPFVEQSFFHRDTELYWMILGLFPIPLQQRTRFGIDIPTGPHMGNIPKIHIKKDEEVVVSANTNTWIVIAEDYQIHASILI